MAVCFVSVLVSLALPANDIELYRVIFLVLPGQKAENQLGRFKYVEALIL